MQIHIHVYMALAGLSFSHSRVPEVTNVHMYVHICEKSGYAEVQCLSMKVVRSC